MVSILDDVYGLVVEIGSPVVHHRDLLTSFVHLMRSSTAVITSGPPLVDSARISPHGSMDHECPNVAMPSSCTTCAAATTNA